MANQKERIKTRGEAESAVAFVFMMDKNPKKNPAYSLGGALI